MLPCVPAFLKFCAILNNYFNRKHVITVFEKPSGAAHRLSLFKGTFQQDYVNVRDSAARRARFYLHNRDAYCSCDQEEGMVLLE
jgi:hypothetical protein